MVNMNNILILTKIFPAEDLRYIDTKVVYFFVKEWTNMGYNVIVVHNYIIFPRVFYYLSALFKSIIRGKAIEASLSGYDNSIRKYNYDGIPVLRVPIKKLIPHSMTSEKRVLSNFALIDNYLEEIGFRPDVTLAHWWTPQLQLLSLFKKKYQCRTSLVIHDITNSNNTQVFKRYFEDVDIWGFRSIPLMKEFQKTYGSNYRMFHCVSGIPSNYIKEKRNSIYNGGKLRIAYVGSLIERKYPISILKASNRLSKNLAVNIQYVGTGGELKKLESYKRKLMGNVNVEFCGRLSREGVSKILDNTDIFIMISREEAFGLVYLEAMASGCITIAARDEGMEGIIINGENGFLCGAGNDEELASIIEMIARMSPEQIKKISDNAIDTVKSYTDQVVAKKYLDNVMFVL